STKLVKQSYPHIKIIILTTFDDDDFIFSALKYGASGYILKGVSPTELHDAITTVYNGGSMINPNIAAKVVKLFSKMAQSDFEIDVDKEGAALITDAEWRVIYQVGRGLSNKEISQELFLSEGTVRNHLSHILSKLNLRDRTQLAIWAVQNAPRKYVNIMKKRYIILSVLLMILVIISGIFIYQKKQNVITIGIYSDSSWDVPNDNEYKFIDYVVKKFEKENPNVKVKYESGINKNDYLEWLSQKIVDNKAPDVFIVPSEQFGFLSSLGTMRNLNYFMDLSGLNTDDYYPTNLKAGMSAGKQYALPLESNPMMMFVNTDLLKKEHITIPKSGWTLNDFYRICRQVTKDTNHDGVVDQFGYADYSWKDAAQAYNAKLFNSQGTASYFNSDKVRQALTMMEKLYNLQKDYKVTADDFDKGK